MGVSVPAWVGFSACDLAEMCGKRVHRCHCRDLLLLLSTYSVFNYLCNVRRVKGGYILRIDFWFRWGVTTNNMKLEKGMGVPCDHPTREDWHKSVSARVWSQRSKRTCKAFNKLRMKLGMGLALKLFESQFSFAEGSHRAWFRDPGKGKRTP